MGKMLLEDWTQHVEVDEELLPGEMGSAVLMVSSENAWEPTTFL